MRMKLAILLGALSLAGTSTSAQAGELLGAQVTGSINFGGGTTNYFDPANGYVPGGYDNSGGLPVTIGAGTEFGFQDGANLDTANFTDSQLIIADTVFSNASPWTMTFTSLTPGLFGGLSLNTSNFVPGLTYGLAGDTITINWGGTSTQNSFQATFDVASQGAVPEPATWAMMLLGFGFVGGAMRSRRRQKLTVSYA